MPKKKQPECPHCGAPTNNDCYKLLVRCASPECGRYAVK